MATFAILETPSHLGLRAAGVEGLPDALLAAGLADQLGARRAGRLVPPTFDPQVDTETGMLNPAGPARLLTPDRRCRRASARPRRVPDRARRRLQHPDRERTRAQAPRPLRPPVHRWPRGLLPARSRAYGRGRSIDLALVTGRGPEFVANIEGRRPLVRDEDVVAFAFRDAEHAAAEGSQPLPPTLRALDLATVRERGVERAPARRSRTWSASTAPPASGSTSTPTCSMTRSCPLSTIAFPTG